MTAQANIAVRAGAGGGIPVIQPPQTEVQVAGAAASRVRLDRLETELGAAPRAWFSVGFGRSPQSGADVRLEHVASEIRPGALVTARLLRSGVFPGAASENLTLFEGRVARIEMGLDGEGESLRFEAEDPAAEVLRRRIGGQRIRTAGGGAERVAGLTLVFNPDGLPNASPDAYDPGSGQAYTIFAPPGSPDATAWTLDKAVAYLLAEYGPSDSVDVAAPSETSAALPAVVIRDVHLEGRTLAEALDALLELVGGRPIVSTESQGAGVSRRLEVWVPGRTPRGWLAHQAVGGRFMLGATQFAGLAAAMRFDAAPRRYVARGDRRLYESTFDLVAGWDDALATYDPDDFSPRRNPDFAAVRDVFRKWVLNEAGEYSETPYSRGPAPDLSGLFEGTPYVRRHRRLLECLSRDSLGRSHGVYVEISLDDGAYWERLSYSTRVLSTECGLYLTDDALPPRYIAAAMRGQVRVRVTATIESDACLLAERVAEGGENLPGRTRHVNVPPGYRFRKVAPTSRFFGSAGADEADDTVRLRELVEAAYAADRRCPAPTRIEMPWLALGHRVGQQIPAIRGRRLDLAREESGYETAPAVRRVSFTFAPAPQTELELE